MIQHFPRPVSVLSLITNDGHKRVRGLKFQSIALPNGLIGNIFGPVGKNLNIFTES